MTNMGGQIIVPKFGDMTQEVIRELTSGRLEEAVRARAEANAIAREEANLRRFNLKFGRLRMRVSQESFDYWGQRLGYECWNNPQFLREYERDNPECRVRSAAQSTSLRVQGRREAPPRGTILDRTGCVMAGGAA